MTVWIILIAAGFFCLISGANFLVNGASALAKKFNVSDLVIGLTIVAFATSAPELVVNIIGSVEGHSDIILGNIAGSNNFNLFLILGISGIILPITVKSSTAWREIPISLLAAIILLILLNDFNFSKSGLLSRLDGIILVLMFLFFLYYIFRQIRKEPASREKYKIESNRKIWFLILSGLTGLIVGGKLVVANSVNIAGSLGVSEKIIGLTIVAAGTSLPELVTSVVSAIKKNSDIAIGNVIGSNIFNILLILSISSIIRPIEYNIKFNTDFIVMTGGTLFLFIAMLTGTRKKLDRWEAGILVGIYLIYTTLMVLKEI